MEDLSIDPIWRAKFILTKELQFPVITYDRKLGTTHANVGDHHWQYYIVSGDYYGVIKELWWEFSGETHEVTRKIPDVWKKVNGGWQMVY